jgi:hypothetical protein
MIQKYRDAGQIPNEKAKQIVLRDIIEPEIVALDYVFDGLQFGGNRRRRRSVKRITRKRNITRRKSRNSRKSRKNRITRRKSRTPRNSRNKKTTQKKHR